MDDAAFTSIVGAIYDAATAPDQWPDLLRRMGATFGCHFCGMVSTNPDRSDVRGVAIGVAREAHEDFLRRFHRRNPVALAAPRPVAGRFYEGREVMARDALERTEMYQAFFRPHDMGHVAAFTIRSDASGTQTISVARPWRQGGFEADDHAVARALMPHLQRAAFVTRQLHGAALHMRAACTLLDSLQQGIVLLDHAETVVHANRAAEALIGARDGIAVRSRRLVGSTDRATRALGSLTGRAVAWPPSGGATRLPRPSGRPSMNVVAIPISPNLAVAFPGEPAAILCLSDPGSDTRAAPRLLVDLFGLTHAEADLAVALLAGQDVAEIAAGTDRSVHTVRKLLARVMAKTDTNRQSELLRTLGRLPLG